MEQNIFQRQSTGFNPLLGIRDWTIFIFILAIIVLAVTTIFSWIGGSSSLMWSTLIGALLGIMPSIFLCLPVSGTVSPIHKNKFLTVIFEKRFTLEYRHGTRSVYVFTSPHWMRWDSNRVTLDEAEGKDIEATVPLYIFKALQKKA